jgi:hypothetical protein
MSREDRRKAQVQRQRIAEIAGQSAIDPLFSISDKLYFTFGDSIGALSFIVAAVTLIITPPLWLKLLLLP